MALNYIALQGRLTRDIELRTTQNGISVASFTLAVNRPFNKNNEHPEADFFDIVAWRNTAEFVSKYFTKGNAMIVEGSLQTRSYEAKDGTKRKAVEVVASNVHFVEGKKQQSDENNTQQAAPAPAQYEQQGFTDVEDELPF